jgi:proline iminopeptidase
VLIDPAPVARRFREQFEREFQRRQSSPEVQALREELAASGLRERDLDAFRHRSFELSVAGYFANPRAARDLTPFRVTGKVQQSVWDSLGDYDLLADADLGRIVSPTLIIHGRQDPIPLASSAECASAIGAKLVVLDQCGHVPYVEQPEALFAAIEEFLAATS